MTWQTVCADWLLLALLAVAFGSLLLGAGLVCAWYEWRHRAEIKIIRHFSKGLLRQPERGYPTEENNG